MSHNKIKYCIFRAMAFQIDMMLICSVLFAYLFTLMFILQKIGRFDVFVEFYEGKYNKILGAVLVQLPGFAAHAYYFIHLQGKYSTTVGKRIFKMKIINHSGNVINVRTAAIRYFFYLAFFLFGVGFLFILFDKRNRGLHDMAAKTCVVFG